jgi:polyhydroxyalkanoate synthesis regulator phasin
MTELKMTPEEIRAHAKATLKRMEQEAKEWEEKENRRIKAELKKKVTANKAKSNDTD